ncbi:hypothetical protein BFF78_35230 [Streptomyces fodineus]|uniref:Cysteinyl-tRNA synthetase n=1 Tax=Streptomyces fodineus TaxID=1904616 RepID=A0A1D7YPL2_9ACTN|nr:hypothetical protein [Streptomyces fodineus]AOR37508.1 hypothetical protein BFF78_35230 [Streptomyces fodineus]
MLHILDARTGEPVPAAPTRRGLTRIEAHACGLDPTALRVLLTADLLVRALELTGTPVWTALTAPHGHAELRTAATTLAIRPFEDARDLASGLGEAQAIHVTAEQVDAYGGGPVMWVAPVEWTGAASGGPAAGTASGGVPDEAGVPDEWAVPGRGGLSGGGALLADPAALRLALLSVPRSEPVRLDRAVLEEAAGRLAGWRRAVAGWARQPSRPVPEGVRGRLRSAWEDDLDLPGVLDVLRAVESAPDLPDGARFETYVYADRLLALDLARDLGSLA